MVTLEGRRFGERDREIFLLHQTGDLTIRELAKQYSLTPGRIHQILVKEKKEHDKIFAPVTDFPSLCDRMDALYENTLAEYVSRKNASFAGIINSIQRYINPRQVCTPRTLIKWLKQATNEDILSVRGIGTRKGIALMVIREDLLKNTHKERLLLSGVKKLF